MSIYRDTNTTAGTHPALVHPFAGTLTANVYRGGVLIESLDANKEGDVFTVPLTYKHTQYDGPLTIVWEGDDNGELFQRTTTEQVITPIVPLPKLQAVFKESAPPVGELRELEEAIRVYIESYTGQSFGYRIGKEVVVGNGEKRVTLPRRLIRAKTIGGGPPGYFAVAHNGWYLYIGNKNWLTTKEAPPEDFDTNITYMTKGVIHVPDQYWKQFRVGAHYTIDGEWGYYTVPDDVQQAALLLANDYACGDNLYRDRYLESIKYSDSNMTFSVGAFRGTGNVRADQLLEQHRRNNMMVVV